jgi:hypothetical protein
MRALALTVLICGCGGGGGDNVDASTTADAAECGTPSVVFLNNGGGEYTPGVDNSSTNVSTIINEPETVAPYTAGPDWGELLTCVAGKFAAFNITITDVDPGTAEHREVVFAMNPADFPFGNGVSGVAPFTCPEAGNDQPMRVGIGYMFPSVLGADPVSTCEVTAQIIGNMFNLDHAYHCPDLMTFLANCGEKTFVDMDVECGEFEARACTCGGDTQNSYQTLLDLAGPACP